MIPSLRVAWIPVLVCTLAYTRPAAPPVMMVADLAGKVLSAGGHALALAEGIPPRREITLAAGARLVVIHLKTGEELGFSGPASLRFDSEGNPIGALPASRRKIASLQQGLRLEPGAWAQASVVMRKEVALDFPSALQVDEASLPFKPESAETGRSVMVHPKGTAILETRPEFRWHLPLPDLAASFRLTDEGGIPVCDVVLRGETLRLAPEQALQPGQTYRWRLAWHPVEGVVQEAQGQFRVLSAGEAQAIQALRPTPAASFAERLAFAVALEARGLRDEAFPYWKQLVNERPGDATLRRFAQP